MHTTPNALFNRIYEYVKQHGKLGTNKFRDEWFLTLANGVVVEAVMEDAGYCHSVQVPGLLIAWQQYPKDVQFSKGDQNGLLTVARMIGFQVDF
jgi:hypothetical protein